MPACTPNSRAGYDAHVTTLRGSMGSPLPPTMIGKPASSGLRRTSTAAWNWSRSTCSIHRESRATELARQALPLVAEGLQRLAAVGELVVHVVGVEQRQQGGRPARRGRRSCPRVLQQHPDVACAAPSQARCSGSAGRGWPRTAARDGCGRSTAGRARTRAAVPAAARPGPAAADRTGTPAGWAFSSSSSSTIISPARLPNRRNSVPLPTPAAAAISSIVTASAPALGDQPTGGIEQQPRLRAASPRSCGSDLRQAADLLEAHDLHFNAAGMKSDYGPVKPCEDRPQGSVRLGD